MLEQFVFVYLLVDAFCLFFTLAIYTKITIDLGTEREVRALRGVLIAFAAFLVADAIWAMGKYDTWLGATYTSIVESVTLLLMGFVAYFWLIYAENRLGARFANSRAFPLIMGAPIVIVVVLYATTGLTGWIYAIGKDGAYSNGPLSWLGAVLFIAYVVFTAVHALICFLRAKSSARKRESLTFVWFAIPPIIFGIVDIVMHGMPVIALSVFASLLLVFMNAQDSRINTDALTGLNNRRRAAEYAEDVLSDLPETARFSVFMIDVDYFKQINDTYGHGEGDRALRVIAEGLRHAMGSHNGLAARWGGDEFLVATHLGDDEEPNDLEQAMRREILAAGERAHVPYTISVSVGHTMAQRGDVLSSLISEADQLLYQQKAAHHAQANSHATSIIR